MGYSNEIYKIAKAKIEERRMNAERESDRRRKELYAKYPDIQRIENEISKSGTLAARAVISGGDVKATVEALRDKNLSLQAELRDFFVNKGYSPDYFEPEYTCKLCKDTGYIEKNGKTLYCNCFKRLLIASACEQLNRTTPLTLSTFDSFDINRFSKEIHPDFNVSPYNNITQVYNYCLNYAKCFNADAKNILMRGGTGLGKTHLSLAIANEVIRRGFGVIYVSAPALMSKLEKLRFSKENEESYIDMLANCDLLIIDDLGTEFNSQFSASQFYNLCNSRLLLRKPFIINTNLSIAELQKSYSERFISRILGDSTSVLNFFGDDIRLQKNFKKI